MRFHNRAIDQVQTVARFCRQSIENTLPDSSPRPAVEPIVRTRVRAVAFGQIAPRDPGPQHVKYCIYDPSIVRARALPTLRHQRLENRPFLIAEIESHDPPPPAVNHDPPCYSVNYVSTDPALLPALLVHYWVCPTTPLYPRAPAQGGAVAVHRGVRIPFSGNSP